MVLAQLIRAWRTFTKYSRHEANNFGRRYFGVFCTNIANIANISTSDENYSWEIFFEFFQVFLVSCLISNPKPCHTPFRRFRLSFLLQSKAFNWIQQAFLQISSLLRKIAMFSHLEMEVQQVMWEAQIQHGKFSVKLHKGTRRSGVYLCEGSQKKSLWVKPCSGTTNHDTQWNFTHNIIQVFFQEKSSLSGLSMKPRERSDIYWK